MPRDGRAREAWATLAGWLNAALEAVTVARVRKSRPALVLTPQDERDGPAPGPGVIGDPILTNRDLRGALLTLLAVLPSDDAAPAESMWEELAGLAASHQLGIGIPLSSGLGVGR